MDYLKITYRDIAKIFVKALPVEGDDFGTKVEEYLEVIKKMPIEAKNALKVAYVFSSKVPKEEREDFFQDVALAVLKAKAKQEKLAYAIARCDWLDFWKKYKIRQHTSLDSVVEDTEGNAVTLGELLVGEAEFENKLNGKIYAEGIYQQLPTEIKPLINKRLIGKALNNRERSQYHNWLNRHGYKLALA